MAAQNAHAERMEGGDLRLFARSFLPSRAADRCCISSAALLVKVTARMRSGGDAVADQLGDAVGDHAGLARPGPGQHQQRPGKRVDGFDLGGIQVHQSWIVRGRGRRRKGGRAVSPTFGFRVFGLFRTSIFGFRIFLCAYGQVLGDVLIFPAGVCVDGVRVGRESGVIPGASGRRGAIQGLEWGDWAIGDERRQGGHGRPAASHPLDSVVPCG